jgi:hypothetical protein
VNEPRRLKEPVDFDDLYPGRFLKAGQLGERKPTVTIARVDVDRLETEKGEEIKGVITFADMPYQVVLNKTNGLCLKAMFGRKIKDWVGKRITLYAGTWNKEPAVRIWGSPEISQEIAVPIKLPKRAEFRHVLHPVSRGDAARKPEVEKHPTEGQTAERGERPPFGG